MQFLQHVSPIIGMENAARLELPFIEIELDEALQHLGKFESPGWDGLTIEFYLASREDIKYVLLQMVNVAYQQDHPPPSWKHGIAKLDFGPQETSM